MFSKLDENYISMNIISSMRPKHTHKSAQKTTPRPIVIALLKHSAKEKILAEDSRGNTYHVQKSKDKDDIIVFIRNNANRNSGAKSSRY